LAIEEVERPEVAADQVLVRVHAASINSIDCRLVRADPILVRLSGGMTRPKSTEFGRDAAGVVEAVGDGVVHVKPGDEVFGARSGALADFVAGTNFVRKPANLTMQQAAAMPVAGITALQAVRDHGRVKPGDRVLVNGAGGGVGTFVVQIAKSFGATVTAVTSTDKLDLMATLGADRVLDYERDDFTRERGAYDAIIDLAGDRRLGAVRRALTADGTLVIVGSHHGVLRRIVFALLRRRLLKQDIRFFHAAVSREDLDALRDLAETGKVMPVIDRVFAFDDTAAAVGYVEKQQARGKVVVTVQP
jgi:NADPH:quinone reductase-like Zn-dependent oxidoreductase